jgi:hypothetical protein
MGEVRGSNPADSHRTFTYNHTMGGDTWRPGIGPRVSLLFAINRTRVNTLLANNRPIKMCHIIHLPRHRMDGTALPRHRTDCTDRYSHHPKNFACLPWRTDRDIFSIRTPFEKVNIPPESGRRDGRNGTVFVAFRAL